jgi:Na+-translocating ferredoxin:NAD+ oxidoreductase RnfG subunit|nr:MAG TPA: hypothetical protein [Caudoviricetes sp.]
METTILMLFTCGICIYLGWEICSLRRNTLDEKRMEHMKRCIRHLLEQQKKEDTYEKKTKKTSIDSKWEAD